MIEQDYVAFEPITERDYDLPGGNNVAVWVNINIEHFKFDQPSTALYPAATELEPDVFNFAWRDYGARVGFWRLLDILDKYDIRASVNLNSEVCEHEPEIVEAGMERDWEWLGHGITNSKLLPAYENEREVIQKVRDDIEEFTGQRPRGWLGPALAESYETPNILADLGFDYLCDWCNDEQPYAFDVESGSLINVPYTLEINDIPMTLNYNLTGPEIGQRIKDQFDVLYSEGEERGNGKVMAIALHPFIIGHPYRSKYLDDALDYITDHEDVLLATGGEIADHFYENYM